MKIAVGLVLVGVMLAGGAYAAAPGGPAGSSLGKGSAIHSVSSVTRKNKSAQTRKSKSSNKPGSVKANPNVNRQDSMTETPRESADQSVQLRGVRG